MLQIPRQVGHIFLATGNRAELLVRCEGKPGDKYVIAAGAEPSPFGPGFLETTEAVFIDQPVVATIELAAAEVRAACAGSITTAAAAATIRRCWAGKAWMLRGPGWPDFLLVGCAGQHCPLEAPIIALAADVWATTCPCPCACRAPPSRCCSRRHALP